MNSDSIEQLEQLVSKLIDEQLSEADSARLNELLSESPAAVARYHELLDNHEALCAIYPGDVYEASLDSTELPGRKAELRPPAKLASLSNWRRWALAASLLTAVGLAGYLLGLGRGVAPTALPVADNPDAATDGDQEQTIAGHATLRRAIGIQWTEDAAGYREGDVLPAGMLKFDGGVVEIDFFCGATLIVEGPATMDLESDWSVRVVQGRLRANVPPAARGFVVKAAESEIVDLGTEFALEVDLENARLEVIDGEVELRGGQHDGDHLVTGQRQLLKGTESNSGSLRSLSTVGDLERRQTSAQAQRFSQWKEYSKQLATDKRLIVYFPIAEGDAERVVRNTAATVENLNGKVVGPVGQTTGRFGPESAGLEFDRPGSRVRTRIDGVFQAFTFACWVRIDGLEHRYNALFMSDGYENGEPHWQIRDDGRLMFSVMVDDAPGAGEGPAPDARLHHIYLTEPFWSVGEAGQWFHLAAVYDPNGRRVVQYINGQQFANEAINEKFRISTLRIGAAEIGNWGQPFRETPGFAVRNLNGAVDELAIFNAALASDEVHALYEEGKPLGY